MSLNYFISDQKCIIMKDHHALVHSNNAFKIKVQFSLGVNVKNII